MQPASSVPELRCREIDEVDIDAVAILLARGFAKQSREFWLKALEQLRSRPSPSRLPKYGYLLECNGVAVGVLLLICATVETGNATTTRSNFSSWYVEPKFRAYAPLLVSRALRHKDVTYLNVSPALQTLPIIEAQGFLRYCNGIFAALPIFNLSSRERVKVLDASPEAMSTLDKGEREILLDHAMFGCICICCVTRGRAYPFVFRPRVVETNIPYVQIKSVIPCAQMVYCRDVADFVRFAGPIGRFLALRGRFLVLVDSNSAVSGLVGKFFSNKMPKYFKGLHRPRVGDLAYTEIALFGI